MPWNGCSARRSESPVTMWLPRPLTASSRNLSSFAAQLCAFQQGIQQFGCESSILRLAPNVIEHLL